VAAAGVGLTMVGLALSPFTLGISLGFAVAGSVLGVAGSLTSGGANIANLIISNSELKKVKEMLYNHRIILEKIRLAETEDQHLAENVIQYLEVSDFIVTNLN
jgi:hypothetical protein